MSYSILATSAPEYEQDTLLLGYCREPQHQVSSLNNKSETLLVDPSKISSSEEFEKILQNCPNLVSIQIGGHLDEEASAKFNLESYAQILELVTKYCRGRLECLTLFFNRNSQPSEEEEELLQHLDEKATHPHPQIWEDFIEAVSPTLKHLIFAGSNFSYNIPHFALKQLLENAPNLENVEGNYSSKARIDTEMDFLSLKDEDIAYVVSLEIGLDNLSGKSDLSQMKEFKNLRHLKLLYSDASQIRDTLDLQSLETLVSFTITPVEEDEDGGCVYDAWKMMESTGNRNLKFSDSNKLKTLVIRGLILNDSFWNGIENRVPFLRDFVSQVAHFPSDYGLLPFAKLQFLQHLVLEVPWNFTEDDLTTLLQSKRDRLHIELYNVQENDPEKNFGKIVEFLAEGEWLKERRDKFGLTVEYPNYKPDEVENKGFVKQFANGLEIFWGKDEDVGTYTLRAIYKM